MRRVNGIEKREKKDSTVFSWLALAQPSLPIIELGDGAQTICLVSGRNS